MEIINFGWKQLFLSTFGKIGLVCWWHLELGWKGCHQSRDRFVTRRWVKHWPASFFTIRRCAYFCGMCTSSIRWQWNRFLVFQTELCLKICREHNLACILVILVIVAIDLDPSMRASHPKNSVNEMYENLPFSRFVVTQQLQQQQHQTDFISPHGQSQCKKLQL